MERLNWKLSNQDLLKYCEYFAIMSFSADAVFYNPLIYDSDNTILTIYYDFFLDEHDKTYGKFFCGKVWIFLGISNFVEVVSNML